MEPFERDIKERIAEINDAIEKLSGEKRALENLLYTRVARARTSEVTDKRSYKRIYNEEKIRLVLQGRPRGLRINELSRQLLLQNVIVKDSTLRSYLTRMAKKGILENNKTTGVWRVAAATGS